MKAGTSGGEEWEKWYGCADAMILANEELGERTVFEEGVDQEDCEGNGVG